MDIAKKISNGEYTKEELINHISSGNPLIAYQVMNQIGKQNYNDDIIIKKLNSITNNRDFKKHKLLGIYTIGDLAIATLLKLGVKKDDISGYSELTDVELNDIQRLVNQNWGK